MQALPGIAGFSRISTRRTASLAVISDAQFHQEWPHLVVVPMRRLVLGRGLRRHELVQRFPQRRHREAADALVEVAARVVAGGGRGHGATPRRRAAAVPSRAAARDRQAAAKASNNFIDTRILERPVLGMPLQRQREGRRVGHAEGLDLAVVGDRLEPGARRQAIDALGMQRVHLHAALAQQAMQQAAFDDVDVVRRRVVDVGVGRLGRAMIAPALDLVHELVQRAAQRHVDLLQAAADREQRHAAVDRMADQRQGGGVARRIVRRARPARARPHSGAARHWTGCRSAARRPACRAGGRAPRSWPSRRRTRGRWPGSGSAGRRRHGSPPGRTCRPPCDASRRGRFP